jgi:hypothetical protein
MSVAQSRPRARPTRKAKPDARRLERSDDVLWTIAPPGVVLHQVSTRKYLELDAVGYRIWALMDGARSVDDVVKLCDTSPTTAVRAIVACLVEHRFVEARRK